MEQMTDHMPSRSSSSRSSSGLWLFFPLVAVFLMMFVLSMQWKEGLIVQRVVVEGARIMSAKEIVAQTNVQPLALEYKTDLFQVRQRLLSQPLVKSAVVSRELPNILYITIVERDPIAVLGGTQLYCIDADGVVLPHRTATTTFDLPFVNGVAGAESLQAGSTLKDKELLEAIAILQAAQRSDVYHLISEVNMNNGGEVVLYSTDGGIPIMLGRGDFVKKLALLQSFWAGHVKHDVLAQLKVVDLRFDGQVVARWDHPKEAARKVPL